MQRNQRKFQFVLHTKIIACDPVTLFLGPKEQDNGRKL